MLFKEAGNESFTSIYTPAPHWSPSLLSEASSQHTVGIPSLMGEGMPRAQLRISSVGGENQEAKMNSGITKKKKHILLSSNALSIRRKMQCWVWCELI